MILDPLPLHHGSLYQVILKHLRAIALRYMILLDGRVYSADPSSHSPTCGFLGEDGPNGHITTTGGTNRIAIRTL